METKYLIQLAEIQLELAKLWNEALADHLPRTASDIDLLKTMLILVANRMKAEVKGERYEMA